MNSPSITGEFDTVLGLPIVIGVVRAPASVRERLASVTCATAAVLPSTHTTKHMCMTWYNII